MIRRATEADIPALSALLLQVEAVHRAGRPDLFKPGAKKYTEKELEKILSDESRPVFVYADEHGQVCGYAFCILREEKETSAMYARRTVYLDDLCVDEAKRRLHIGSTLFAFVRDYAQKNGYDSVTLNVWHLNEGAMRFYERLGMKPMKTTMEMLSEDRNFCKKGERD